MGTGDLPPHGTNSVPSTGDMQETTCYTQQSTENTKEHVNLPPAAVKIESHEQTQHGAEVPKEHAKHPPAVVKNESNEVDGHTQEKSSKEHPKPLSSVIDFEGDDDIENCEAEDEQKAKSSQCVLKTPHANSMPDAKVKKEWIERLKCARTPGNCNTRCDCQRPKKF